jgi:hypothetical protein
VDTKQILIEARELISDKVRWTTEIYASDTNAPGTYGRKHQYGNEPGAVCWCAFGAVQKVTGSDSNMRLVNTELVLTRAADELFKDTVTQVNDRLGHEAVMQMYDRAIELADD